jgi:hypothetical protein
MNAKSARVWGDRSRDDSPVGNFAVYTCLGLIVRLIVYRILSVVV